MDHGGRHGPVGELAAADFRDGAADDRRGDGSVHDLVCVNSGKAKEFPAHAGSLQRADDRAREGPRETRTKFATGEFGEPTLGDPMGKCPGDFGEVEILQVR